MITTVSYTITIFAVVYLLFRSDILGILHGKKKLKCKRQGLCCRLHVEVTADDIKKLKKHNIDKNLEIKKGRTYIKRINGFCPYLKIEKGTGTCTVHSDQPRICRTFPKKKIWGRDANDCRCERFKTGIYKYI